MGIGVLAPGMAQQTVAVRAGISKAAGRRGGKTTQRRRKKKAAAAGGAPKRKRSGGKVKRLVKGSAAAKAWMAKIRKKRK